MNYYNRIRMENSVEPSIEEIRKTINKEVECPICHNIPIESCQCVNYSNIIVSLQEDVLFRLHQQMVKMPRILSKLQ